MKMYILVKDSISTGFAAVGIAHASLKCYLDYSGTEEMCDWLDYSFKKVICKVNEKEFEKAKECIDHTVITESALNDEEIVIAFKPREEWPKQFKFFRKYNINETCHFSSVGRAMD